MHPRGGFGEKAVLISFSVLLQTRHCLVELLSISPIFSATIARLPGPNEIARKPTLLSGRSRPKKVLLERAQSSRQNECTHGHPIRGFRMIPERAVGS